MCEKCMGLSKFLLVCCILLSLSLESDNQGAIESQGGTVSAESTVATRGCVVCSVAEGALGPLLMPPTVVLAPVPCRLTDLGRGSACLLSLKATKPVNGLIWCLSTCLAPYKATQLGSVTKGLILSTELYPLDSWVRASLTS